MLFGEDAPHVEKSGPSHGGDACPAPTPRMTQRVFSSDEEESTEWVGPRLGLVRRGRCGRRARHPPRRRRRAANPFVQFAAEDGYDEESAAESESAPRSSPTHPAMPTSSSTHTQSASSDSDDSESTTESTTDSFVAPDDCFE